MSHNIDTVLADCRVLAYEMATARPLTTMTVHGVRNAITERFAWLRYEDDISLVTGMLAALLSERGWRIIFDDNGRPCQCRRPS